MTDKEIMQALRCSATREEREKCEMCRKSKHGCLECINSYVHEAADLVERLTAENAKAEAERDALLEQIKARRSCSDCKHFDYCEFYDAAVIHCMNCVTKNCPCHQCVNSSRWEWRGLAEAPEEGEA